jgi:hypothetical protein
MALDEPVGDSAIPVQTSNDANGDTSDPAPVEPVSNSQNERQSQDQPKDETMIVESPTKDYEQPPTPG